jgi:Protein of unknown function (DUF2637)
MTLTPAQYSTTQRRLLTTLGGLGVAALAAGTFVLSYDDLRLLALRGGAARHWAFLYPAMVDGLVVVIILAILTARRSGWFSRSLRWLLLLVLIAGAGAAGVQRAVKGFAVLPDTPVNVGVAVAPWAILIIAVWLWVGMIKQMLSLRARRSRSRSKEAISPGAAVEAVPATVVDQSIVPGLDADTRQLPLPASVRELEPVREPVRETVPSAPEPNPWDAARIDTPEPWGDESESWGGEHLQVAEPEQAEAEAEAPELTEVPQAAAYAEPNEPVPASWLDPDEDDTQPLRTKAARPASDDEPADDATDRHEPLLAPTVSRLREPRDEEPEPVPDEPAPDPLAEAPMHDEEPVEDPPTHPLVARTFLPTDVRLVGGPKPQPSLSDTQPDGIKLPDTQPDGIPLVRKATDVADEDDDTLADERAEDPDAGEDASGPHWEDVESTPPSSKFRSSPTPPRD